MDIYHGRDRVVYNTPRGILKYQLTSLSPWDTRFVVGGTRDGKLSLFDIIDGVYIDEIGNHEGYVYCVRVADHWKFDKIVVSCGFDGKIKVWANEAG